MNNAFYYDTPIGKIGIIQNDTSITNVCFGEICALDINIIETPLLKKANEQIQEYLNGERKVFNITSYPSPILLGGRWIALGVSQQFMYIFI